jgi:hypothetical protein
MVKPAELVADTTLPGGRATAVLSDEPGLAFAWDGSVNATYHYP